MNLADRVFKTLLNPDEAAAAEARWALYEADVERFRNMPDAELAEKAAYYLGQMGCHWPRGEPVYDGVMHHIILPELIRRLRD